MARTAILVIVTFLIYSCSGIFCKLASRYDFMSILYMTYFAGVVAVLGIYAILWQKILERMPLNKAFSCKSMTIVFALVIAHFMFGEQITMNNVIGTVLIMSGLVVLAINKKTQ